MRKAFILALALLPLRAEAAKLATADFLNIPVDARTIAMGEASQAVGAGAAGAFANPTALSSIQSHDVYFTHSFLPAGISYDYVAWGVALKNHYLGLSHHHVSYGTLEGRDNAGNPSGDFSPSDTAYTGSWAARLGGWPATVGASARYIESKIADKASTWTMDAGTRWSFNDEITFGLSGSNLGGKLRYDRESAPLPATIKGGLSWRPVLQASINLDAIGPLHSPSYAAIGAEYWAEVAGVGKAAARIGFNTKSPELGAFAGMRAGVGFLWKMVSADYAFSPAGDVGDGHHLGISYRFGGSAR